MNGRIDGRADVADQQTGSVFIILIPSQKHVYSGDFWDITFGAIRRSVVRSQVLNCDDLKWSTYEEVIDVREENIFHRQKKEHNLTDAFIEFEPKLEHSHLSF